MAQGQWRGLRWYDLPADYLPPIGAAITVGMFDQSDQARVDRAGDYVNLFAWSGGYVAFVWDGAHSVVSWSSADGLRWTAGKALPGAFSYGLPNLSKDGLDMCDFQIDSLVEGPAGLLTHGSITCHHGSCPGSASYSGTWASSNGVSWTVASDVPQGRIGYGGAGYVITAGQQLWTSVGGKTWDQGQLPATRLEAATHWGQPISFPRGFVVTAEPDACLQTQPDIHHYFWSPDGKTWTQLNPPAQVQSGETTMSIGKLNDGTLMLSETTRNSKIMSNTIWTSADGQSWRRLIGWSGVASQLQFGGISRAGVLPVDVGTMTWGDNALFTHYDQGNTEVFYGWDSGAGQIIPLRYTGEWREGGFAPAGHNWALGPSGLLATNCCLAGAVLWKIAVPTA